MMVKATGKNFKTNGEKHPKWSRKQKNQIKRRDPNEKEAPAQKPAGVLPLRSVIRMKIDENKMLARGEWKYGGVTPCLIVIQAETMWPGSGDVDDPAEIADDRYMPCVSVWYENPGNKGTFNAGGGYFQTIEEAIEAVTKSLQGPVIWQRE